MEWKLAEAKNKFSEVVRLALSEGPQRISRRNDAVVVLSEEHYERLVRTRPSFKDFLLSAPDMAALDFERDPAPARDVRL